MSIEETGQAEQAVTKAAPLLQTLGDPAAAVCVDGFCAVPETNASATNASATNASATNASATNTSATKTRGADK
jgi:hypothetical protein